MQIKSKLPEWAEKELQELNNRETELFIAFMENHNNGQSSNTIIRQFKDSPSYKAIQTLKTAIYEKTVPTLIITCENEEDKNRIKNLIGEIDNGE